MNRTHARAAIVMAVSILALTLPVHAETRIDKSLKLEPGGKLTVLSDVGSVEVTGSASSGAHVVLTSDKDDLESRFTLKFEELPGEVRITMRKKEPLNFWSGWFHNSRVKFQIEVPGKTATAIETGGGHVALRSLQADAKIDTSGGHIEVTDLKGRLTAETSGGHISLKSIAGDAKVETSGGHIEVHGIDGNLSAETSGGHIEIHDAKGRVDADTSGGHVEVGFAKGNARGGKIESSGGGITVAIDPNVDLVIDASTSGGSVRTDVPVKIVGRVTGSSIQGTIGKGGETLYVHTSGGSVSIGATGGPI
ncbi:MAG TPA: hypothetical protein VFB67_00185 [Candidatus Polarisedimenticolaceae bacterium]|nr:hypothetical protein [Candidatus Polarisedimenticolaceae bacterium]